MKKLYIFIMICALFITGCTQGTKDNANKEVDGTPVTNSSEQDTETQPVEPVASFGGELKVIMRNPSTLNPLLNNDRTVNQLLNLVFDSLFILNEEEKPVENLVESYTYSDTGSYMTLTLKKNILFHDGEELHAEDVVYSIDTIKSAPEDAVYKVNVKNYKRAAVVDDYTVRIYFEQPFSFSRYTLTFPIIPKHHFSVPENQLQPIGTGAYAFNQLKTMKEMTLTANTNWFKGKVYIEKIKAIITRNAEADADAFRQKVVDLINPTKFDWQQYADRKGTTLTEYPTYYYTFLGFNFNNKVLSDRNMRKIIATTIDRESIVKEEFLNHAYVTEYPLHPLSWLSKGTNPVYTADENKAKEMMAAAGFADTDDDKVLERTVEGITESLQLRLLVNQENSVRVKIAEKIKASLEKVGFVIHLDAVDYATYQQKVTAKDFDLLLGEWKLSSIPDFTFAFHSSQIAEGNNFISYNDPVMDRILQAAFTSVTEHNFINAMEEFKNTFVEELPYFSLFFRTSAIITNERVHGQLKPSLYNNFYGIEDMFIFEQPE
ncbi:peptide ABC transporter substrate-binding protein [Vallitalea pronyensis]|uniref:Peptide ABC transporter substrate-binding protein n=1 Tax=Vallitalea pronyensis TaxID=1348613 RepID=A0A8J8ML07_9FIRM|nr:peptide ABC transporter substrate-binding protein [Vallitalea pronyensis]QUI23451.1 peptide ABC transporter substrate-binding protein [Vallitalea pronyensis]